MEDPNNKEENKLLMRRSPEQSDNLSVNKITAWWNTEKEEEETVVMEEESMQHSSMFLWAFLIETSFTDNKHAISLY